MKILCSLLVLFFLGLGGGIPLSLPAADFEEAPFHYWTAEPKGPVARLQEDLRSGAVRFPQGGGRAALDFLLNYFGVSPATQVLVYSKTSAQNALISPATPRAIYFSDSLYLGWVQGGGIEILSFDPHLGALCYFVDTSGARPDEADFISRPQSCMDCHVRSSTGGAPGGWVRSVFPGLSGMPLFQMGSYTVDHSTPIQHRWGGWYVTGSPGDQNHLGNALAEETAAGEIKLRPISRLGAAPLKDLAAVLDARAYPGGAFSDVVALMVLEHQVQVHNALVSGNFAVRRLEYQSNQVRSQLGQPRLLAPEGTLAQVIESHARQIVEVLLFKNEIELSGDGVQGSTEFVDAFCSNSKRAACGSLKDLRLYRRLFKNRCSYAIYSQPFQFLTPWLKAEVHRQLLAALTTAEGTPVSDHLSLAERLRIVAILRETLTDLPREWYAAPVH